MRNGIEWLGFYPLFHAAALWQNQGYTADGESYNAMWIPIFLVCAAFFLAWAIGQALFFNGTVRFIYGQIFIVLHLEHLSCHNRQ